MAKFLFYDDKVINLLLEDEKPTGGAAVQAYGWIKGLLALGHEVYVLTKPHHNQALKEDCQGINVVADFDRGKGVRWLRWVYYRLPHTYKALKQVQPDYLYKGIPSWESFLIGLMCMRLNIKFIQRISNDFLIDRRFLKSHSRLHRFFQNLGFKLSDFILCQNDYQFGVISKKFPGKKVYKLSNPIVLAASTASADDREGGYIAWLGLFQHQKNLKLLYEIAAAIPNEQFVIAGNAIPKVDSETLRFLDKLQELPNVEFIGFLKRHEVPSFLRGAKYLLNTSHYEGFSNTFLEAMANGTPILTTDKVNPDGLIDKKGVGLVYRDAKDLLCQVTSVTPESYTAMSNSAVKYVMSHHDHKHQASLLAGLLENEKVSKGMVAT
ncbi:glycosyltransferase family 4 protein [Pontibacter actiniarum]|uniref:Group 1 glycosyl transferase n=1 Tax=Pontibacter actiniarum TaxID=323450 RepID=A0A1X9YMP6_9BACT|nr:glycosyltransferase family 4 protein [Pontibacter actiniarum]ARS34132.1 group 1 glycosyl transferase [Pontibacter actiniarum]